MSILKTKKIFTYLVVGALVIALYISCKSNEEPTGPKAGTNPPAGEYSSIAHYSNRIDMPYTNKATVTHNGNGCTISGTLLGVNSQAADRLYKSTNFSITVNSWYENSDGNGSFAQGERLVLNSPANGSLGGIKWFNTDSGNAAISFQLSDDDGFYYNPAGTYPIGGLTN